MGPGDGGLERPAAHGQTAGCCVLPSGRVAVVGGLGDGGKARPNGEMFDPAAQTWHPLPPSAAHERDGAVAAVVAVMGGLLAVGRGTFNELFEEASGRWFGLPHPMVEPRVGTELVSLAELPQQTCVVSMQLQ